MRWQRYSLCLSLILVLLSFADTGVLENLLGRLKEHYTERPQQKLYLHLDKPFYAAGDNIWYKSYLMEGSLHGLDSQSRVVYVELLDARHRILNQQMLYSFGGISYGDFKLPDTLPEGQYALRAYTNYMRNFGEEFFFFKEISVFSPHQDPMNELQPFGMPDLQFFAEGGNFVAGGLNRLAFKALSPDGKGMHVGGEIVDEAGRVVGKFSSEHKGMGMIELIPEPGKRYHARITEPHTIDWSYPLPEVEISGYHLYADAVSDPKDILLTVQTTATTEEYIHIIVQSRGQAYYASMGKLRNGTFSTRILRERLPDGISQLTVFDAAGKPVAERLIYQQNCEEKLELTISPDAAGYGKRNKVELQLEALYRNGNPALGHFSVSVYNEGLIDNKEQYPMTIVNYLSLTSDLKGHIEEPGYYFKDTLETTRRHLDLLMQVHGWRRFTWKDVLSDTRTSLEYNHEQGIPISGRVLNERSDKRSPESSILKILTLDGDIMVLSPGNDGLFYTDELLHYDPVSLVFQTENRRGRKQPYKVNLDEWRSPMVSSHRLTSFVPYDASAIIRQSEEYRLLYHNDDPDGTLLEEVVIKTPRQSDPRLMNLLNPGGYVIDIDKDLNGGSGYTRITDMLMGRIPGLYFSGQDQSWMQRGSRVSFLIDGFTLIDPDVLNTMSPLDVEFIELVPAYKTSYGVNAINVTFRKGPRTATPIGIDKAQIRGFYEAREFYSPNYVIKEENHVLPDKRTTLYWEPMVITDDQGRASVAFFTGDVPGRYRVVAEGITATGYPGTASVIFEVK